MTDDAVVRTETGRLTERVAQLDRALELAGDRVDPVVAGRVSRIGDQVRDRLGLGVDHTVVALLGGTGSGKSSVFNAVAGFDFAEVGVKRPTTSRPAACVWGTTGDALLEWLEVDSDRRIERESELDGEAEAALRGLVLLDLPDHDSVDTRHRETVDRLMPMADLLVWVVDPQKYADDALHSGYLQGLVGHEGAMLVLLNQIDRVQEFQRAELLADIQRLLAADGLTGVPVRPVSARTGEGVADLRDLLAEVVGERSLAARRGSAEITDAAGLLTAELAPAEPGTRVLEVTPVSGRLAEAAGLPAIADAVAAAVRGGAAPVPSFVQVQADTVDLARGEWVDRATAGLPRSWSQQVLSRIGGVSEIRQAADDALARVAVVTRRSAAAATCFILSAVSGVAAILFASVAGGRALSGESWADAVVPEGVVAVVLAVFAVILVISGQRTRRRAARSRAERVRQDGRGALEAVARAWLAEPTAQVFEEHRQVRELAEAAARD